MSAVAKQRHLRGDDESEDWLQAVLGKCPEILQEVLSMETSAAEHGRADKWHLVGREVVVDKIGNIDLLFITSCGRPVIVETKLFKSPEARRQVVAQVAEYGLQMQRLSADELLADIPADPELDELRPDIDRHLRAGKVDLVAVGDAIDDRALALGDALLGQSRINQMCIWFVEVRTFAANEDEASLLLVPVLRHASIAEVREVVEVRVSQERGAGEVIVSSAPPANPRRASRGPKLTEEDLLRAIEEKGGHAALDTANTLLALGRELGGVVEYGEAAASVRILDPTGSHRRLTLFVLSRDATFYVGWLDRWERISQVDASVAEVYRDRLIGLLGSRVEGRAVRAGDAVPLQLVKAHLTEVTKAVADAVRGINGTAGDSHDPSS